MLSGVALAATLAAALVIVVAQPVRSPWWTYADADATYTAASLNLLLGADAKYLDHPGLPIEEIGAVAFGAQFAAEAATGGTTSRLQFAQDRLLALDETRPVFRGLAIAFYLAGALFSFLLAAQLFRHWTWGLAGGLLWIAAPGLAAMSIQFRPDVLLSALLVVVAYLLARAVETRSAAAYGGAAVVLGLATMVKMHAAGMLPALVLAALWRRPEPGWERSLVARIRDAARGHRAVLAAIGGAWLLVALLANADRLPFDVTREMALAAVVPWLALAVYLVAARAVQRLGAPTVIRRLIDPFLAFVGGAFLVGVWIPVTLELPDGLRSIVNVGKGLTGTGINEPVEPFSAPLDQLADFPLRQALFVFALAGVAAVVGLVRRQPLPVVLFLGAAVLGVMAQARLAAVHYFAPALVVSVPAALWLLRRERPGAAPLLVWPIILLLIFPQFEHRDSPGNDQARFAGSAAPSLRAIERRLQPDEVGLAPSYWPHADVRYFGVVQYFVTYTPTYPYRILEAHPLALELAQERGLRFRYYTGPQAADITAPDRLDLSGLGTYAVRPVPGASDVVELLDGPGVAPVAAPP